MRKRNLNPETAALPPLALAGALALVTILSLAVHPAVAEPFSAWRGGVLAGPLAATTSGAIPRLEDWPDGPVRYLTSYSDLQEFRKLKTDAERALFIVRFWRP